MLSAIARLNPHVDMKKIVIGLMDRLSTYAQRESEGASTDEKQAAEEDAVTKLLEKVSLSHETKPEPVAEPEPSSTNGTDAKSPTESQPSEEPATPATPTTPAANGDKSPANLGDVKLFEIFYEQVVNLVKTRGLPIQDTMALLTSLANLAL